MAEKKYLLFPGKGFKSDSMKRLNDRGINTLNADFSTEFVVEDEVSADGPKVISMDSYEVREFKKTSSNFRIFPIRKYQTAVNKIKRTSRKKLSSIAGTMVQNKVFVKERGTNLPLQNVTIIAIIDVVSGSGVRRRTGKTGQATITIPSGSIIKKLYVYPPGGYWGRYHENFTIQSGMDIFLDPVDPEYIDFLKLRFPRTEIKFGEGVKVGIVDTGVYGNHSDLNLKGTVNCVSGEMPTDVMPSDGHGTHVAGIVGGKKFGIAPECDLYSYKVFPHLGSATNADIIKAIEQGIEDGCDIINLSLGGGRPDPGFNEAIGYAFEKGCIVLAAAGNSGKGDVSYPALFKRSIAVSAIGNENCIPADTIGTSEKSDPISSEDSSVFFANFSNIGREIDITAPGVSIISTWLENKYHAESGTSMACPIVTGYLAALLSKDNRILTMRRDIRRSLAMMDLLYRNSRSIGFPQMFEGIGTPNELSNG